jgi:hypothetical protein
VDPVVVALHRHPSHEFSKSSVDVVTLVAGIGVDGDAHAGPLVQHRSRVAVDPMQPNLRQVHLLASELFDLLAGAGHEVAPGALGENVTTAGLDVEALAVGAVLALGADALVAVTGLRNPCRQIERFQPGLLRQVGFPTDDGFVRRAGVMGVVLRGGEVRVGDAIAVAAPPGRRHPLVPV